ncbi:Uncharacterised protein [Mycobacteroides abscessus subsp. abscessus]|nr:Uncharacterised protein [Mycobacteroides abscessus subsp. abscessus]
MSKLIFQHCLDNTLIFHAVQELEPSLVQLAADPFFTFRIGGDDAIEYVARRTDEHTAVLLPQQIL